MPERERDRAILRVHSVGSVPTSELRYLLGDIEHAYNGITGFDHLVQRAAASQRLWRRILPWSEVPIIALGPASLTPERVAMLVPIDQVMYVRRVKLESPGFWDFLGRTLSLEALNEWLNGRQNRRERRAEAPHRQRMTDLDYEDRRTEVIHRRYRAGREMGLGDDELAPLANELVAGPLNELDRHVDSGLISGSEVLELPPPREDDERRGGNGEDNTPS